MKRKRMILVVVVILVFGFVFTWFNIIKPCEMEDEVRIFIAEDYDILEDLYDTSIYDSLISRYNGKGTTQIINDEKLVRTDGNLPSDKTKDYKSIAIEVKVKNRSIFDMENFVASIDMEEHSDILYTYGSIVCERVESFKTGNVNVMWLEMYCGDMTDEEIVEYIKGLTIKVSYGNGITGVRTEAVKISDVIEVRR